MKLLAVPFLALALTACAKSGDAPVAAKVAAPVAIDVPAELQKLVQPCIGLYWTCNETQIGMDHTTLYSPSKHDYALLFNRFNTPFMIVMRNSDATTVRWSTDLEDYR